MMKPNGILAALHAGAYLHHLQLLSEVPAQLAEFYGSAMDMKDRNPPHRYLPGALPRQAARAEILDAAIVDHERAVAAAWQGYEGQVLALRPDRYVMGAFPETDPESAALAIEALSRTTGSSGQPGLEPEAIVGSSLTNPTYRI